jgi:hypothetical protein
VYNLGLGDNNHRNSPTQVTYFQGNSKVVYNIYLFLRSAMFLTEGNELYGVGYGGKQLFL